MDTMIICGKCGWIGTESECGQDDVKHCPQCDSVTGMEKVLGEVEDL